MSCGLSRIAIPEHVLCDSYMTEVLIVLKLRLLSDGVFPFGSGWVGLGGFESGLVWLVRVVSGRVVSCWFVLVRVGLGCTRLR